MHIHGKKGFVLSSSSTSLVEISGTSWAEYLVGGASNATDYNGKCNSVAGVRIIVTLKPGVKTNDAKDTEFLDQTCWALK